MRVLAPWRSGAGAEALTVWPCFPDDNNLVTATEQRPHDIGDVLPVAAQQANQAKDRPE
jgi:hypothetical protein